MDKTDLWKEIEERLQFVPPFFTPAADNPEVLANLWQQTKSAYLDSPLPSLFKEKLAALLGRYCEVPYCLVCHTCTLRPLGMAGPAIVSLLTQPRHSDTEIVAAIERLDAVTHLVAFPVQDPRVEQDLLVLGTALYFGGPLATRARACLRARISPVDYQSFVAFVSYNRMCHEWMAAHPEVSYELDQRYLQNYGPLAAEAPALAAFISAAAAPTVAAEVADEVAEQRAEEALRSIEITERRFQEVLGNLNASIAAAAEKASAHENLADELRRSSNFAQELLAIVSHDLRTPLNAVLLGAQLVASSFPDNEKITRPLARVVAAARRGERMIHDLLDFSQARAGGGIPIRLAPGNIHELARRAVDEIAQGQRIKLTQAGDGAAEFDPDRLIQAVSNLLTNALSHGLAAVPIDLHTRVDGERVTMEVRNANRDGPIPEELASVLFDPFKRGVTQARSPTRSIGLGLYIVDQIVTGHRGRVRVVSHRSSDTTSFIIELPRTSLSPDVAARASRPPVPAAR